MNTTFSPNDYNLNFFTTSYKSFEHRVFYGKTPRSHFSNDDDDGKSIINPFSSFFFVRKETFHSRKVQQNIQICLCSGVHPFFFTYSLQYDMRL